MHSGVPLSPRAVGRWAASLQSVSPPQLYGLCELKQTVRSLRCSGWSPQKRFPLLNFNNRTPLNLGTPPAWSLVGRGMGLCFGGLRTELCVWPQVSLVSWSLSKLANDLVLLTWDAFDGRFVLALTSVCVFRLLSSEVQDAA